MNSLRRMASLVAFRLAICAWKISVVLRWVWFLLRGPSASSDSNAYLVSFQKLCHSVRRRGDEDAQRERILRAAALDVSVAWATFVVCCLRLFKLEKVSAGVYARVLFRDQVVSSRLAGGAAQVIIIGGGFEIHALECVRWASNKNVRVRVIELDFPHVQRRKLSNMAKRMGQSFVDDAKAKVRFVECGFGQGELSSVLAPHVLRDVETVVVIEGVSMYVPKDDFVRTLKDVAAAIRKTVKVPIHLVFDALEAELIRSAPQSLGASDLAAFIKHGMPTAHSSAVFSALQGSPYHLGFPFDDHPFISRDFGIQIRRQVSYTELVKPMFTENGQLDKDEFELHFEHLGLMSPAPCHVYCLFEAEWM